MIRCVIIDDEEMAVERIAREINNRLGWEIVATCKEYSEARSCLLKEEPDICFMDISIISGSGMELAKELSKQIPTKWIFSTAFQEYAIDAFAINALGYLLKPYENKRLAELMQKAEATFTSPASDEKGLLSKIAVKSIGEVTLVNVEDIMWVKGASNYVELYCKDKTYLHRATLINIELQLPKSKFVRVHRSAIVNIDFIKKIGSELGRYSLVILKNNEEVKISSAYKDQLFRFLKIG